MEIVIVRKKIGFIQRTKMMMKVKNFWGSFKCKKASDITKAIMKDDESIEALDVIANEMLKAIADEIIIDNEKQDLSTILLTDKQEIYIGIFLKLIEAITPDEVKSSS